MISTFCAAYGAGYIMFATTRAASVAYKLLYQAQNNFPDRYGKNNWAVVTGASSGIGLGFAKNLAKSGMNVLLVSNEESSLETISKKLTNEFGVKTAYKALDLSNPDPKQYTDFWDEASKDKYISIMVNGAAPPMSGDPKHESPFRFDILGANYHRNNAIVISIAHAYLTKLAMEGFKNPNAPNVRKAIINITSYGGVCLATPYNSSYVGIKRFWFNLTEALAKNKDIDVIQCAPLWVKTKLIGNPPKLGKFMADPDDVAKYALRLLGKENFSYGDPYQSLLNTVLYRTNHQFRAWFFQKVTDEIVAFLNDMRGFQKELKKSKGFVHRIFTKK